MKGQEATMVLRSIILVIVIIYFLTPYSVKDISVRCQCGCQEFICYCCQNPENLGDVPSFSECRCNIVDEFYDQPEGAIAYSFEMDSVLDQMDHLLDYENGSALPGYRKPPMKPPPTV